jgi:hypothetical protein
MSVKSVRNNLRRSHLALGAVLMLGLTGQAFAGTSLSCAGFPKNLTIGNTNVVQVCKIVSLTAPLTASLSVEGNTGNVFAHGGQTGSTIPVFARVIAQDTSSPTATMLADSVDVTTSGGVVTSNNVPVNFPESLQVDYEVFTPASTAISLSTQVGNVSADTYSGTLSAKSVEAGNVTLQGVSGNSTVKVNAGDISLQSVNGDMSATAAAGDVTVGLSGTGWVGQGLTVSNEAGNTLLSRPSGYAAKITATSEVGEVDVDGTVKKSIPATITTGAGQPIKLSSLTGTITVNTTTAN